MKTIINQRINRVFILLTILLVPIVLQAQTSPALPAVGTHKLITRIDSINIEVAVQSPADEKTPLQVACVFEYADNDIYAPPALPQAVNGIVHLDKGLNGIITELRKSGKFTGHAFETILINVPNGTIAPRKLLLVGLGNRNKFDPEMMVTVGTIGMREALRLGVTSYAHASDLKDGGIDSPTALIAGNVLKGAIAAYRTQLYLKSKKLSSFKLIKQLTFLAGQPFYQLTDEGLKKTAGYIAERL